MALATLLRRPVLANDVKSLRNVCNRWSLVSSSSLFTTTKVIPKQSIISQQLQKISTSPARLSQGGSDHTGLWKLERIISVGQIALIPLAIIAPNKLVDTALALCLTMHMHWGLESVIHDYIRKIVFGPVIPAVATGLCYLLSVITLAGLMNLIYNDVGIGQAVRLIWSL